MTEQQKKLRNELCQFAFDYYCNNHCFNDNYLLRILYHEGEFSKMAGLHALQKQTICKAVGKDKLIQ